MTKIPRVTITAQAGGWTTTCTCGWEIWTERRPAADKAAHDHQKTCKEK